MTTETDGMRGALCRFRVPGRTLPEAKKTDTSEVQGKHLDLDRNQHFAEEVCLTR